MVSAEAAALAGWQTASVGPGPAVAASAAGADSDFSFRSCFPAAPVMEGFTEAHELLGERREAAALEILEVGEDGGHDELGGRELGNRRQRRKAARASAHHICGGGWV